MVKDFLWFFYLFRRSTLRVRSFAKFYARRGSRTVFSYSSFLLCLQSSTWCNHAFKSFRLCCSFSRFFSLSYPSRRRAARSFRSSYSIVMSAGVCAVRPPPKCRHLSSSSPTAQLHLHLQLSSMACAVPSVLLPSLLLFLLDGDLLDLWALLRLLLDVDGEHPVVVRRRHLGKVGVLGHAKGCVRVNEKRFASHGRREAGDGSHRKRGGNKSGVSRESWWKEDVREERMAEGGTGRKEG